MYNIVSLLLSLNHHQSALTKLILSILKNQPIPVRSFCETLVYARLSNVAP